jgi:putative GTP pyrophosphokinase
MNLAELRDSYQSVHPLAERFRAVLCEQLSELLASNHVSLGVPIESRVKSWSSLADKIQRKELSITLVEKLHDLVGVRLILLFRRDVDKVSKLLERSFIIVQSEDTSERLGEAQFGYQSLHYVIRLPEAWLAVPTFQNLYSLYAEIQVRTLAQHMWAASSHKLQYKQEESVPSPVRRAIHRVSALLETVDLEFERVLLDRETYLSSIENTAGSDELNVDLLARILDELLPPANKKDAGEPYAELLEELGHFKVRTAQKLREVIVRHLKEVLEEDAQMANRYRGSDDFLAKLIPERLNAGAFYNHAGLMRKIAEREFGDAFKKLVIKNQLRTRSVKRTATPPLTS